MPEEITLRLIEHFSCTLLVQVDDETVHKYEFDPQPEDGSSLIKAAELALRAAGWEPDLGGMYSDMALTVLKFHRAGDS